MTLGKCLFGQVVDSGGGKRGKRNSEESAKAKVRNYLQLPQASMLGVMEVPHKLLQLIKPEQFLLR